MATTNDAQPIEREWLSVKQTAAYLSCGPRTVYAAIGRGELKAAAITDRGDYRIKREWIDTWLTARAEATASKEPYQDA